MRKLLGFLFILMVPLFLMIACGKEASKEEEIITLKVAYPFNVANFETRIVSLEDKLENIKFEAVPYRNSLESLEDIFASDVRPDIFFSSLEPIMELDVALPLDDLIEEYNFDLSTVNQSLVQYIRTQDPEGRLLGLPDGASYIALYYNKEIFDMFGEPYPDPNKIFTWDELLDLARKLTAERDGIQYIGLEIGPGNTPGREMLYPLRQFAVNATDPETGEVLILEEPAFKQYFEMVRELYNIPGIYGDHTVDQDLFAQKQAAMTLERNLYLQRFGDGDLEYQAEMDMIAYPVWSNETKLGPYQTTTPMIIANYTEYKKEAFEVLLEYMSHEHQIEMIKPLASATVLKDREVLKEVAVDVETYKGKNREAFYALEPAHFEGLQSRWDQYVDFASAVRKLAETDKDVNTVLRELKEESEAKIKNAKEQE